MIGLIAIWKTVALYVMAAVVTVGLGNIIGYQGRDTCNASLYQGQCHMDRSFHRCHEVPGGGIHIGPPGHGVTIICPHRHHCPCR